MVILVVKVGYQMLIWNSGLFYYRGLGICQDDLGVEEKLAYRFFLNLILYQFISRPNTILPSRYHIVHQYNYLSSIINNMIISHRM